MFTIIRKIFTVEKTSGSSGEQGEFYLDREAFSKIIAAQTLYWELAGYSFGKKAIHTEPDVVFNDIYYGAINIKDLKFKDGLRARSMGTCEEYTKMIDKIFY